MKWLWNKKDGGPESRVWMYGLESKRFGSVLVLRFEDGSREAYHSHAFNCVSRVLSGQLVERLHGSAPVRLYYSPRSGWFQTFRTTFHKVTSLGRTWVLTFRGPWSDTWQEYLPAEQRRVTLTHGRREVA